ncbi:MAG: flagellin hook IN motif-containing protein, partial [Pseudomonadota bacterium]
AAILNETFTAATDSITAIPSLVGKNPYINVWAGGNTPYVHNFATDGATVQDLINGINGAANGVTASFNTTTGKIELDGAGELAMTLGGFAGASGLQVQIYQHDAGLTNLAQAQAVAADPSKLLGEFNTNSIDFPFGGGANSQNGRLRQFIGGSDPSADALLDQLQASPITAGVTAPQGGADTDANGRRVHRMVFRITGTVNIPAGGTTAIRNYSDDGFSLTIGGQTLAFPNNTAPALRTSPLVVPEGLQPLDMIWWENGGQEAIFAEIEDAGGNIIPIGGSLVPTVDPVEPETIYYERAQELQTQIQALVQDSSYLGTTLGQNEALNVQLNETGARMRVQGNRIDATGLGLDRLTQIDWLSNFDKVDTVLIEAKAELEAHAAKTANALAVLQIRKDFNDGIITALQGGADKLTLADPNEEGAKLLASQTRMQFSNQALLLSTQADQGVLGLFR